MTKEQPKPPTNSCVKWKKQNKLRLHLSIVLSLLGICKKHMPALQLLYLPQMHDRRFCHLFTLKNSHLQYQKINDLNLKRMCIKKHLLIISSFRVSCSSSICSVLVIALENEKGQETAHVQSSTKHTPRP